MAQPEHDRIAQAFQVLADQANRIPNIPAVQGIQQINIRLDQMQQMLLGQMQHINQQLVLIRAE